jgi:hypothetical protein
LIRKITDIQAIVPPTRDRCREGDSDTIRKLIERWNRELANAFVGLIQLVIAIILAVMALYIGFFGIFTDYKGHG